MTFLAPLMLIGLAAIAVPIAIHLIGRARAKVVRFAALDFLLATKRRTARRLQLRERALLIVRALACLAIPLALAKPLTTCRRDAPLVASGPQAAVLVIDDGFASGYRDGDGTILAAAQARARAILTQLGPEAEVAVLRASEDVGPGVELSRDHLRLRDRIGELTPAMRPADLTRALTRAAQVLAGSGHRARTVFLISPLFATSLRAEPPWGADGPALVIVDLSAGKPPRANLAVTRAEVERDGGAGLRGIAVSAEIANFGAAPVSGVDVLLRIGGQVVARGTLDLPARERRVKRFVATLPEGARLADATIELPADALPIDDRRWIRTSLPARVRTLLVDGDPRTSRHDDELFFLRAALRPGDSDDAGIDLTSVVPDDLGAVELAGFDVVVLANVAALPPARAALVQAWVEHGGGLLIATGDRVDAAAYAQSMAALLPQPLADPIDLTWGVPPAEQAARALRLSKWDDGHAVFAPFAAPGHDAARGDGLVDASFRRVTLLGPAPDDAGRKVLARYSNGGAALVERSVGSGRVLLLTSTLDRDWNDLPLQPAFLPLAQRMVHYLARKNAPTGQAEHLVGQTVVLPTGDLARLEVRGPGGPPTVFERDRLAGRRVQRFERTDAPGLYRVLGAEQGGAMQPLDELAFAVNLDSRGSDVQVADAAALPTSGASATPGPVSTTERVELWHAVAALLLLLLLAESLLIQR